MTRMPRSRVFLRIALRPLPAAVLLLALMAQPAAARADSTRQSVRLPAPSVYEFSAGSPLSPSPTSVVLETAFAPPPFEGRPEDPWLAFDKVQHLTFSFLWTLGSQYALVNKASWSEARALPVSAGLSGAVGVAKEVYDWRRGARQDFSRRDLVADAAGILLAAGFILL